MNILICTYSITRTAGGVFDAVKDLFTNKTFHKHNLKIISFYFKNRHKAQRKAKFYINKCRSASCMQSGLKQASA